MSCSHFKTVVAASVASSAVHFGVDAAKRLTIFGMCIEGTGSLVAMCVVGALRVAMRVPRVQRARARNDGRGHVDAIVRDSGCLEHVDGCVGERRTLRRALVVAVARR